MNYRNLRVQEMNRIKNTAQTLLAQNQVSDTSSNHIHGYRSTGFFQAARELPGVSSGMIVGSGYSGGGTNVS